MLLKEISYRWGKHQILEKFKLVLLICLRDPAVQQMFFIDDLFRLFCKRDKDASKVASVCGKYFVNNNGKDLALIFDGYDEYPERLRKDSLIFDILERKVLPHCGLIVSSRPHSSVRLRQQATVRVYILGFTEDEREYYIKESMKDQIHKINELTEYLKDQLTDLPEPYNKVIQQLSKLSLEALNNDKLIFTFDEIKAACPHIETIPGAINGFDLLQAVEHFGFTGTTTSINFLHFSIQEHL